MQTFIFDFDGTLADSKQCSVLATQQAFQAMDLAVPTTECIEYYMGIPIEQSFKEMASTSLDDVAFEALLNAFRQAYKELENDTLTVFPYIPKVLRILKEHNKSLYVVSSKKSDVLRRNLQTLHIAQFFDDLIGSDQVEHYKPHPDGILKLVARHQFKLEDAVMIGDAIFDIQMGQAADCRTCAITWGSHSKENLQSENPTYLIEDVHALLQL
ncbi:HAD family hydrolase [Solibacillus sp. FSL H8-0538]|uniref:HAD family hydrolase n=1 Tax=Solibacillus sp. FSL H8-0538 TaxID=2921400 RepID=UPI0030F4D83A